MALGRLAGGHRPLGSASLSHSARGQLGRTGYKVRSAKLP
jgi:hypothetical protein